MRTPKHVLVTGAEGALGGAALRYLAPRVERLTAACRTEADRERLSSLARQEGWRLEVLVADLADPVSVKKLIDAAWQLAPVEGLLNAAGGFRYGEIAQCTPEDYDFLMNANAKSVFLLGKELGPRMADRGYGRMVFVSSYATQSPAPFAMAPYVASKLALNALVQGLATELKAKGVTVNAVMPTVIDTPANRQAMPNADVGKWVKPEDLVGVAWTLMGDEVGAICGALVPVPGGL